MKIPQREWIRTQKQKAARPAEEEGGPPPTVRCLLCPASEQRVVRHLVGKLRLHLSSVHYAAQIRAVLAAEGRRRGGGGGGSAAASQMRCPECGMGALGRGGPANLVRHYGTTHGGVVRFADRETREWLEELGAV